MEGTYSVDLNPYGITDYEDFLGSLRNLGLLRIADSDFDQHSTHQTRQDDTDQWRGVAQQSLPENHSVSHPDRIRGDHHNFRAQGQESVWDMRNYGQESKYRRPYSPNKHEEQSSDPWYQVSRETRRLINYLNCLQEILERGDDIQKQIVSCILEGMNCIPKTDKHTYIDLLRLVETCKGQWFNLLVDEALSHEELFLNATFIKKGANLIIKLLKKLKKSRHAFTVTSILSTRFWDIMTHHVAKDVIENCVLGLRSEPNKILFENAIIYVEDLAVHKDGCRSLTHIINTIAGEQRSRLLDHLADVSCFLSNHPYGNYVVQNVLKLKNSKVTERILSRLQGRFVELSQQQAGSKVVDKCMESSVHGVIAVIDEIIQNPKAPFLLAQHQFGNYVIQNALVYTKGLGLNAHHSLLVKYLWPHRKVLNQTVGGKNVSKLLKDESQLKWQS